MITFDVLSERNGYRLLECDDAYEHSYMLYRQDEWLASFANKDMAIDAFEQIADS